MSSAPGDYIVAYRLETLLSIHTAAFQALEPVLAGPVFTICFWVKAQTNNGMQVIVNCGHRHAEEPGWSCFLRDGRLVVSVRTKSGRQAAVEHHYPQDNCWHHVAAIIDGERPAVTGALDGAGGGWQTSDIALQPEAPAGGPSGLTVGGYTDAAGGHFNYTFGRNGAGYVDDLRIYGRALAAHEIGGFAPAGYAAPPARFTWDAPHLNAPVRIRFQAEADAAAGATCLWTWPDGRQSIGRSVERNFPYAGSQRVRLDLIDAQHAQASVEEVLVLQGAENPLRVTPVFSSGEDGYAAFRIPSIVRACNGDLVAFAEGRVESASDSTATIRIVSKTSRDNGRSWSRLAVVARNVVAGVEYAAMNASPAVDSVRETGRIVLLFKKLECSEWEIVQGRGVMRTFCIFSDDHGRSWHGERDITGQVHRPYQPAYRSICPDAALSANRAHDWRIQVPMLGHAIQLCGGAAAPAVRGRILHIGSRTQRDDSVFESVNYAFWSDDLGESWQIGDAIAVRWDSSPARGLNEATAVELADGRVMVNSRNYVDGQPRRQRAVTIGAFDEQGRITFEPASHDGTLIEPAVQASLLRYTWPDQAGCGGRSRILFANPAHQWARVNMTVRLSYDEGVTWPVAKVIDPGPSAYSDLVIQGDGDIGLLYERGNAGGIVYAGFPLAWLTDGQDVLPRPLGETPSPIGRAGGDANRPVGRQGENDHA
jgi:sialidase-1